MQNYFAKMNDLSKNWENGLDIYIYIYIYIIMIPEMLIKCVKDGGFMDEADDMRCVWKCNSI